MLLFLYYTSTRMDPKMLPKQRQQRQRQQRFNLNNIELLLLFAVAFSCCCCNNSSNISKSSNSSNDGNGISSIMSASIMSQMSKISVSIPHQVHAFSIRATPTSYSTRISATTEPSAAQTFQQQQKYQTDQTDNQQQAKETVVDNDSKVSPPYTLFNIGQWEEMNGNYILRPQPPYNTDEPPRALIHFLGGAIVGAAPDITYRYILEKFASRGFLVVATPFTLSFDYIQTCDDIITRFERVAPSLAQQYGPIPVIGVGHSCGSLLQLLITTLFPDTPRAANVLISYNNKGVKDAVPFFEEVVAPAFAALGTATNTGSSSSSSSSSSAENATDSSTDTGYTPASSTEILNLGIDFGRTLLQGNIPSDEAITNFFQKTAPPPLASALFKNNNNNNNNSNNTKSNNNIQIPPFIRENIEQLILDPITKTNSDIGISPLLQQSLDIFEQIPSLIQEVADGAKDFNPTPSAVRAVARRAYRARRTLILQYEDDDNFDESEEIESLLKEAETIMKNKRPMLEFDVRREVLKGGHATPCIAPPLDLATKVEDLVGEDLAKKKLLYQGADDTVDEVVNWLEEGNL